MSLSFNIDASFLNPVSKQPTFSFNVNALGDISRGAQQQTFNLNNNATLMNANDYQRLDHRSQIYKEPDMYLGSIAKQPGITKVLDFAEPSKPKFVDINFDFPDGCRRLILELLYNGTDNVVESRSRNHPSGEIDIKMDNRTVTIRNGGIPIPITIHDTEKIWTPQLIFATLLTSGQYKKAEKTGSGKNGYGAKLTNIFSKWMRVRIGNPYHKKTYEQIYEQNMTIINSPIITDGYIQEPFVEVSFVMDFEKFGYTGYPNEVISWVAAVAAELAFTIKVPVTFNGHRFEINDVLGFKELTGHATNNYIIHYEYPEGTEVKNKRMPNGTMTKVATDDKIHPLVELCLIDSPDCNDIYAFANSANTREGGVHVEQVYDSITDVIITTVNNSIKNKKDDKLNRKQALNKSDLKRHLSLIVSCNKLINPSFTSQEKVKLTSPKPKIKIEENIIKKISNWELALRLYADLEAKLNKGNKDGKSNKKYLSFDGYDAANNSGVKGESHKCVLYEVEGLSAMGYARNMKSSMPADKRSYVGLFAQMGKPMNVRTAKLLKFTNSDKIKRFLTALGLDPIKDPDYTKDENFKQLNYGCLAMLNDADVDGKHISALILNIIYCRYRSLLTRNFIVMVRTPIIRIWKGKVSHKFYSQASYKKFIIENPECGKWEIKYYKGLGSSEDIEVEDETKNPKIAYMIYDDTANQYFDLAFGNEKGQTDKRKEWISKFELLEGIEDLQMLPISKFLNHELLEHAKWSMARTIPRFDGLKNVQRKIIFGSFEEWGANTGTSTKQVKTSHLGNGVSKITDYIHGEISMIDSINKMVLSYTGSNNLNYFVPKGQFGTRHSGGLDAGAPRYTFLYPEWWWPYIFRSEDTPILTICKRDGGEWEPELYLPIFPLHMLNGCLGIGTGSSTFMPNYNPVDIYNAIIAILASVKAEQLIPWYRGFKGKISIIKRDSQDIQITGIMQSYSINLSSILLDKESVNSSSETEDIKKKEEAERIKELTRLEFHGAEGDEGDEEPEVIERLEDVETDVNGDPIGPNGKKIKNRKTGLKMVTMGIFEKINKNEIYVSEIPIGKSFDQYKAFLELLVEKKELKKYTPDCSKNDARFTLYGFKQEPTHESLGLIKSYSLTNMVMLDEQDRRTKYNTPNEVLEKWVEWRLPFYQKRKDYMLKKFVEDIKIKQDKIKFISCVIDGIENGYIPGRNIIIIKNKKDVVYSQMDALEIPRINLKGTGSDKYTLEDIQALQNKINDMCAKYKHLEQLKIEQLFINDLNEFIQKYLKEYPDERSRLKN